MPSALRVIRNFYPRPPRGGRPFLLHQRCSPMKISIHALREEGDQPRKCPKLPEFVFLSTPSARRATRPSQMRHIAPCISIHALREEGDVVVILVLMHLVISIHALREEGDAWSAKKPPCGGYFYPRPPRGGRLYKYNILLPISQISIHALREEGDVCGACAGLSGTDFYPRPPRGGRQPRCVI